MTTARITIDDTLLFSDLKTALSLFRVISGIEVDENSEVTDKLEYEQFKSSFFNGSKRTMAQHISKYSI